MLAFNSSGTATAGPWSFTTAAAAPVPVLVQAVACPAGVTADVSIVGFAFSPASVNVTANTIVKWTNNDATTHTVTSTAVPANEAFDSGNVAQGGTVCFKFTTAGSFSYHCSIHPFMTGAVTVR